MSKTNKQTTKGQPAADKPARVGDIPGGFHLVTDSQEIASVLEYIGQAGESFGCLFVEVLDGDYGAIYGVCSAVPRLDARVWVLR